MGRDPRTFDAHEIYHLTGHGVDSVPLFADEIDYQEFVLRLGRAVVFERWEVFAACLVGTHHHLIFRPTRGSVSDGMRLLHGGYSRAYNKRHRRRGALFESRFRVRTIRDHPHLLEAIRYVALNPVRAGLVASAADWPWSTYGQLVGTQPRWPFFDPLRVLAQFGSVEALRVYVEAPRAVSDTLVSDT